MPMLRLILLLLASLLFTLPAPAAPPSTLSYQGRLADSGGQPTSATLAITFRLYDVPGGGIALWTETQPAVDVDGGNLAVELGSVTPLPGGIWGRQLWLGVQVAGDSEMLPRPPLTAAPYALRAAGTMRQTVVVSAEGTPAENGAALLSAIAALGSPTAEAPRTVELDAGTFDLGGVRLDLPSHVTLVGRGEGATLITSSFAAGTLLLASYSHVRQLTARNTGTPAVDTDSTFGIGAAGPNGERVERVSLQQVTGEAIGATGAPGARQGLYLCTADSVVRDATGRGVGGNYALGMRSDCGNAHNSKALRIDGLVLHASGAALGLRGTYISGGGDWRGIDIDVVTNNSTDTAFGLRLWPSPDGELAVITDLSLDMAGGDLLAATAEGVIEGMRLEHNAAAAFSAVRIGVKDVKAAFVAGIRHYGDDATTNQVRWTDLDLSVQALVDPAAEFSGAAGIRLIGAVAEFQRARVHVRCLAGSTRKCAGIHRTTPSAALPQPGTLVLEQVGVHVTHDGQGGPEANVIAFEAIGAAHVTDSTLRVLLSPDDETHAVADVREGGQLKIIGSTLELLSPLYLEGGCALRGDTGTLQVLDSVLRGGDCTAGTTLTCVGITKRSGFLPGSCQ